MLNEFTAIIFNFSVDDKNVSSLTKVYGYITIDNKQTYITDYSNTSAGRFDILICEKKNNYLLFFFYLNRFT
jgi:hypothetical protein